MKSIVIKVHLCAPRNGLLIWYTGCIKCMQFLNCYPFKKKKKNRLITKMVIYTFCVNFLWVNQENWRRVTLREIDIGVRNGISNHSSNPGRDYWHSSSYFGPRGKYPSAIFWQGVNTRQTNFFKLVRYTGLEDGKLLNLNQLYFAKNYFCHILILVEGLV